MNTANKKSSADLQLAFDVGHSSIGWAVLESRIDKAPELLGCGSVIFPADDCLASERRTFRRQRRHIRATRLRITRLKRLLAHLGVLDEKQLDAPGCAWPWLLAARVLRGGNALTWNELWEVLRWYGHNRGYDGNKGWSRHDAASAEDTEKEQRANELLASFHTKHGRQGTMAEVFCDVLKVDPLGAKKSSIERVRNLGAAFPREGVEAEVEQILRAHLGTLSLLDERFIEAVMRDYTALPGPDYRLPARYGQRLADGSRRHSGVLFGQLIPRFDNRIIAHCPIAYEREWLRVKAEGGGKERAKHEAEKLSKVPGIGCAEFHRFRWAMQLANVLVETGDARKTRRLTAAERCAVHAKMEKNGYLTVGTPKHPGEFAIAVRAQTGGAKDNLDQMLALPDADRALVLDPALRLVGSGVLSVLWPFLITEKEKEEIEKQHDENSDEAKAERNKNPRGLSRLQRHLLTDLRRGKAVTARELLASAPVAEGAFSRWWDGEAMKKLRKGQTERTRDQALDERHALPPANGRAPHTREVMRAVVDFVLKTDRHPMEGTEGAPDNGPLFRSEAIRQAQLQRALDEQTNNHLVRHRLKLLERLHEDLIKEPKFANGDRTRVARVTIEVNREVKEMSGKTAQEQAKEQGAQTKNFRDVAAAVRELLQGREPRGFASLVRKARVATDLNCFCPYTGRHYDLISVIHGDMALDHIIPYSLRPSDSLDSLVVTTPRINDAKKNMTGLQFVKWLNLHENLSRRDELGVWTVAQYEAFVKALSTKGHPDDERRKKNRKRMLMLENYVEKEFTPGDLTKTSQLVRLGAQALQKHYVGVEKQPVITSLPGRVTASVRNSWNLTGCLAAANQLVLNPNEIDEGGRPKVRTKTEIRGITHLHHALDACVLAFASHLLPRDGATWNNEVIQLLSKRRLALPEQAILRVHLKHHVQITSEGEPRIKDLEPELREQLCRCLAQRRVVQHLPAEWGGLPTKETVWRVFDPKDPHPNAERLHRWLKEAKVRIPDPDDPKTTTVILTMRKRRSAKDEEGGSGGKVFRDTKREWKWVYCEVERSKVLGLGIVGDKKLRAIKGGKLIDDNYGMALFPNAPKGAEKFRPIRFFRVWEEMERLKKEGGGKRPPILRRGQLIYFKTGPHAGKVWRVLGLQDNGLVRFFEPDTVRRIDDPQNYKRLQITGLLKDGLEIVGSSLCGIAPQSTED